MDPKTRNVLQKIGKVHRHGDEWFGQCPAHADSTPSLAVKETQDGRVLLYCHAGCETETILEALELDWSDVGNGERHTDRGVGKSIVARHPYVDEDGELLYENVRYTPKDFRLRRPDGHGDWIYSIRGARRVPYRLPDVKSAIESGRVVWLVEGEKDADRLAEMGLAASNLRVHDQWSRMAGYFAGADVVIISDSDEAGSGYAQEAADALSGHSRRIRMLQLPGVDDGEDVSDWLDRGGTLDELQELALETPEWSDEWQPHSREAEESVLGEMIRKPEETIEVVRAYLSPGDFYFQAHRIASRELLRMWDDGIAIDRTSLISRLEERGYLSDVGGKLAISQWLQEAGQGNIEEHARIVQRKAAQRDAVSFAGQFSSDVIDHPDEVSEIISNASLKLEEIRRKGVSAGVSVHEAEDVAAELVEHFAHLRESGVIGIPTGYRELDRRTKGLRRDDITLIGARPGRGKSTLMTQLAIRQARMGYRVGLVSMEMDRIQIGSWAVMSLGGLRDDDVQAEDEASRSRVAKALEEWHTLPISIIDSVVHIADVVEAVRQLYVRQGCQIIYLDHFHFIEDSSRDEGEARYTALARRLATSWKHMTSRVGREANFVWLCQLRREVDSRPKGRPRKADFRNTGMLEAYATLMLGLSSPELVEFGEDDDESEAPDRVTMEVGVVKNRYAEDGVYVPLQWDRPRHLVEDMSRGVATGAGKPHNPFLEDE